MAVSGHAVCKTVGSAYVGSNPTPATSCEKGPPGCGNAARRAVFFLSRHVSLCVTVGRCIVVVTDI